MLMKENQIWLEETTDKIIKKMDWASKKSAQKIPSTAVDGIHDDKGASGKEFHLDDGINWWTNGFWPGMMWMMYQHTGKEQYRKAAEYVEERLDACFLDYYGLHHDVGFMWLPSAVADYKLTGSPESRKRALHAASLLAGRFNPVGRFIRAWNDLDGGGDTRGWAIIDCLFNIPLLYWATEETGDPRFKQIAMIHADTVMEHFIRPDGSACHIVEFNPVTGEMVKSHGGQGYAEGSSWTRGQAWALYGFAISYLHTGKPEYLDTAKRVAHYFMANIPEDGIIPVDFCQPEEPAWEDSSAAAIAACGLLEIAGCAGGPEQQMYRDSALRLLRTLEENRCDWSEGNDCIVMNCSGSYHEAGHHYPLIYGDFFFMEAIWKLRGAEGFLW